MPKGSAHTRLGPNILQYNFQATCKLRKLWIWPRPVGETSILIEENRIQNYSNKNRKSNTNHKKQLWEVRNIKIDSSGFITIRFMKWFFIIKKDKNILNSLQYPVCTLKQITSLFVWQKTLKHYCKSTFPALMTEMCFHDLTLFHLTF